jgi:hypothetical protein
MALLYLDPSLPSSLEAIGDAAGLKDGQGVSTIKLAIAAAKLGFNAFFCTRSLYFNPSHLELAFYQSHGDMPEEEDSRIAVATARELGVQLSEVSGSVPVEDILAAVTAHSAVVVLLDFSVVAGSGSSYSGHFVTLVGYDEHSVIVHDPSTHGADYRIPRPVFDAARFSQGTDEVRMPPCHVLVLGFPVHHGVNPSSSLPAPVPYPCAPGLFGSFALPWGLKSISRRIAQQQAASSSRRSALSGCISASTCSQSRKALLVAAHESQKPLPRRKNLVGASRLYTR